MINKHKNAQNGGENLYVFVIEICLLFPAKYSIIKVRLILVRKLKYQ